MITSLLCLFNDNIHTRLNIVAISHQGMEKFYKRSIKHTPQDCFNRAVKEYKATGAKNIAPMGMMCDNVAVDEIKQFPKLCENSKPIFWWDY